MLGRYKIGANKINSVVFICWVSLALKSDDHVPSMQTNQFAGKRHMQFFCQAALLAADAVLLFVFGSAAALFVVMLHCSVILGFISRVVRRRHSNVTCQLCVILFSLRASRYCLYRGRRLSGSERNIPADQRCHCAPSR